MQHKATECEQLGYWRDPPVLDVSCFLCHAVHQLCAPVMELAGDSDGQDMA
jgi:hypothetical protein